MHFMSPFRIFSDSWHGWPTGIPLGNALFTPGMSRHFSFLDLAPFFPFKFAHRATQMAWARNPISRCIDMNREGMVLLEINFLGI